MRIDRHNYESWFLRYVDRELLPAEQAEVDAFVLANPDLAVELEALLVTQLQPETPSFPHKSALYRRDPLTPSATESELLNAMDGELTVEEQVQLQARLAQDHALAKSWQLFQQTKLSAETITFPHKASLYRREKTRVVPLRWVRYAAAAVLLLGFSWGAWMAIGPRTVQPQREMAGTGIAPTPNQPTESATSTIRKDISINPENNVNQLASAKVTDVVDRHNYENRTSDTNDQPTQTAALRQVENISADTRNLSTIPNVSTTTQSANSLASTTGVDQAKETVISSNVSEPTPATYASYASMSDSQNGYPLDDEEFEEEEEKPRSKVGGLLRQVKRSLTGNAQAGSNSGKTVRVAAFKIASH